jgi:hypothetical protein
MRINEALTVTLDDLDLTLKPSIVTIRGENTRNRDNRITFLFAEPTQAVTVNGRGNGRVVLVK